LNSFAYDLIFCFYNFQRRFLNHENTHYKRNFILSESILFQLIMGFDLRLVRESLKSGQAIDIDFAEEK